jgi:hypothetical protein
MFSLNYISPAELRGKIEMAYPIISLGTHKDIYGNVWDVRMATYSGGKNYVSAVPIEALHPYYSDTSDANYGFVSQAWEPYEVIIHESNS